MKKTPMLFFAAVFFAAFAIFSCPAFSLEDGAMDYLLKTAPRPAGMGGAFTAVPADPIGMMWNPSAALRADRLTISRTHSIRHFPGARKNLDQLDSDLAGAVVPLAGESVIGFGATLPGEWGVDYMDSNGVLKEKQRYRGRERRVAFTDLDRGVRHNSAGYADSNWYRDDAPRPGVPEKKFQTGGGFSFYYETDNGMMYGINIKGLANLLKKKDGSGAKGGAEAKITLGAAYRPDQFADTLGAADLELSFGESIRARWFAGVERSFEKNRAFLRFGSMNGMPTYGAGARSGSLRLDYAVIKNFLPEISGEHEATTSQDAHFVSYTLQM